MDATVLVIGGGGREHVLAWKLSHSTQVKKVYVCPGNAGTEANGKISNVCLNLKQFSDVSDWCKDNGVNLVIVGPEDPLADGINDHLTSQGIACFGPSAKAAQIEASKDFAKQFMVRHSIPTARYQAFTDSGEAVKHIQSAEYKALVVKASGLAAGKGVIVAQDKAEACEAARNILEDRLFGSAGETVIVEELLEGEEVSCLAFSDGATVAMMPPAQDHKRLNDGDRGPNTGGMGAYCPYTKLSETSLEMIKRDVLQKAVDGMRKEGMPYVGVLYAGLMLTEDGPKVLEFNCRFGDPETQSILPLLKSDLYVVCKACVEGRLQDNLPEFDHTKRVLGVVLVSGGYPVSYQKGLPITGLDDVNNLGLQVFHAGTTMKDGKVVTSGGRVLAVVAIEKDFDTASSQAQQGATMIKFDGVFYRKDIGYKVSIRDYFAGGDQACIGPSYRDAGVDIAAGSSLVEAIKPMAGRTSRPGCTVALGSFGALFDIKASGYKDPLLVSGTDGVGTKLKIAHAVGRHDTIGIDLVAMCVNDILAHGAEPLYFLDYFATGKLDVSMATNVIAGIAKGCEIAGCALVGGETAEMPGLYGGQDYDLAGFAVGAVERNHMLPKAQDITPGDAIIGLASSGIHSNGFSLVRKVVDKLKLKYDVPSPFGVGHTLGEDLLTPTKIYVKSVLPQMRLNRVKAFAHITGGGLIENIPRILPDGTAVMLDAHKWKMAPVFGWLHQEGKIQELEMAKTFNCGIGAVLIVGEKEADDILEHLKDAGEEASVIGFVKKKLESDTSPVIVENLRSALGRSWQCENQEGKIPVRHRKKVGVLISGSGTNLQALIDHTKDSTNGVSAEIVLVISNKAGVQGLERAKTAGISTKVINHKDYKSREEFDEAVNQELVAAGVEILCLAGFMRILTGGFVKKWKGRLLNVHPSLLPAFKGAHAHKMVLESGVRISGCSVHFVAEEVDAGAILVQESVPVYPGDTEETLSERVKTVEHNAYPKALELLASEQVVLGDDGKVVWKS